ncbi:MAG: aminomethyl-transferring glycine dehydrogenase subunit GcvPA [bacterium]
MKYLQLTDGERNWILKTIGVKTVEELFQKAGVEGRVDLNVGKGLSEIEVLDYFKKNEKMCSTNLICFMGGGTYDHQIPAVIDHIIRRVEFYTSYTPYQPELSQGTLQSIYEYQTMVSRLTGMEVANASMYDGATALAEAILMACRIKSKRKKVILPKTLNPLYKEVVNTYISGMDIELMEVPFDSSSGYIDKGVFEEYLDENILCSVFQYPNFLGVIEKDLEELIEKVHNIGGLAIVSAYPISLGLLRSPGSLGADITTCEGQSMGLPLSLGGPYLGVFTTKKEFIRSMPGRIIARTLDTNGRTGYVMTLQAREQHIRRQKATSNICTNEQLCALAVSIYLATMGDEGIREVARQSFAKTEYLKSQIAKLGFKFPYSGTTFNEFVVDVGKNANEVIISGIKNGIAPGISLGNYFNGCENYLLIAVTEKRTKGELDGLVRFLEGI